MVYIISHTPNVMSTLGSTKVDTYGNNYAHAMDVYNAFEQWIFTTRYIYLLISSILFIRLGRAVSQNLINNYVSTNT